MGLRDYAWLVLALGVLVVPLSAGGAEPASKRGDAASGKAAAKSAAMTEAKPSIMAGATDDPADRVKAALQKAAANEASAGAPSKPVEASRAGHAPPAVRHVKKVAAAPVAPPAVAVVAPAVPQRVHWSYDGPAGPHTWARLSPEWAKCGSGARQSPIDIREGMRVDLEPLVFEYSPSRFRVIDNGHTIQANVGGWNALRVMGRRFRLVQFHFHSPSEEMIDGKQFEMVAHLVHRDGEGRLAVVAVLIERGARQPAIQTVLNHLPLEKGEEYAASVPIDLNQLLPEDRRYFTYMGSLTTPPCSEDVLWIVMKQPVQATVDQLNLFARLYPMNARPVQDSGDRIIKESN